MPTDSLATSLSTRYDIPVGRGYTPTVKFCMEAPTDEHVVVHTTWTGGRTCINRS